MLIKSLDVEFDGEYIITDIDDCLIYTSKSIRKHCINKRLFYFNSKIYEKNKHSVFSDAEFTEWGIEFLDLVGKGLIKNYKLITKAGNRIEILCDKFNIDKSNILESMSKADKIGFLNSIESKAIYIDDKVSVIEGIDNKLIATVNFPKKQIIYKRKKQHKRRF